MIELVDLNFWSIYFESNCLITLISTCLSKDWVFWGIKKGKKNMWYDLIIPRSSVEVGYDLWVVDSDWINTYTM